MSRMKNILPVAVALTILVFAVAYRFTRGPGLIDWSETFGFPVFLDERIRVIQAGDWGMGWTIKPGDWVLYVGPGERTPVEGDIILYMDSSGKMVAHRVVGVEEGGFRTRGDNLPEPDSYLVSRAVGVVIGVIYGH